MLDFLILRLEFPFFLPIYLLIRLNSFWSRSTYIFKQMMATTYYRLIRQSKYLRSKKELFVHKPKMGLKKYKIVKVNQTKLKIIEKIDFYQRSLCNKPDKKLEIMHGRQKKCFRLFIKNFKSIKACTLFIIFVVNKMRIIIQSQEPSLKNQDFEVMSKSSIKIKKISSFADILKDGVNLANLRKAVAVGQKIFVKK